MVDRLMETSVTRTKLVRQGLWLAMLTIAYNLLEGFVSIWFGFADESLALMGFGLDSLIEVASACVVLWRLSREARSASGELHVEVERVATRLIGYLFLGLALSIWAGSLWALLASRAPESSLAGFVIALLSLSFMVALWRAKLRLGQALDSATLIGDANCSLACVRLSGVLLLGSILFLIVPALWWVDSAAAIVLAAMIWSEGIGMVRASWRSDFTGGCSCGSSSCDR